MIRKDITEEIERHPYQPLRLHLASGKHVDLPYENTAWVRQNTLLVVYPLARGTKQIGNYDVIALSSIERVEHLPQPVEA